MCTKEEQKESQKGFFGAHLLVYYQLHKCHHGVHGWVLLHAQMNVHGNPPGDLLRLVSEDWYIIA